jgi:predicted MFS family arabinose efflux permease
MVVAIALVACLASAMCLFKVQPLIPLLMENLGIGETKAGMLMSIFSLSGIFLAVPGAMLIQRFGIYRSGAAALICLVAGCLIGLFGVTYSIMLFSRLVEGVGMALLAIIGIMAVAIAFPPEKRGAPMGIICLYVSLGELSMLTMAPGMAGMWSWRGVWWFCILFCALAFLLWAICFRRLENVYRPEEEASGPPPQMRDVFTSAKVWLLVLAYTLFIIAYIGVFAFWPSYLNLKLGYELTTAGWLVSLISLINIPASFLCGMISDKLETRKGVIIFAMLACAASYYFIPGATGPLLIALLTSVGIFCIAVPALTFTAATEIFADPGLSGLSVSLATAAQNAGLFIGPVLMGILIESYSWELAFQAMAPITVAGAAIMFFCRIK